MRVSPWYSTSRVHASAHTRVRRCRPLPVSDDRRQAGTRRVGCAVAAKTQVCLTSESVTVRIHEMHCKQHELSSIYNDFEIITRLTAAVAPLSPTECMFQSRPRRRDRGCAR